MQPTALELVWWAFVGGVAVILAVTFLVELVLWLAAPRTPTTATN